MGSRILVLSLCLASAACGVQGEDLFGSGQNKKKPGPTPTTPAPPPVDADIDAIVAQAIAEFQRVDDTGVGVIVTVDGEVAHMKGYGLRDRAAGLAYDEATLFSIGSTTKAFAGFGMAQLHDRGQIDMYATVRSMLPSFALSDPIASEQMRPVDLVSHRSGFAAHNLLIHRTPWTRQELYERLPLLEDDPTAAYGASFIYNNLMFMAAGVLTEAVTGLRWEDYIAGNVLEPLGMSGCVFNESQLYASDNFARPYVAGEEIAYWNAEPVAPAGSLACSLEQMAAWLTVLTANDEAIITQPWLETTYATHNDALGGAATYGMGWVMREFEGGRYVHHGGGLDGFEALVSFVPEQGIGVAVFVNEMDSRINNRVAQGIYRHLLGLRGVGSAALDVYLDGTQHEVWPIVDLPQPSLDSASARATYRHPAYGDMVLHETEPDVFAMTYHERVCPLEPVEGATFMISIPYARAAIQLPLTFVLDQNGDATSFTVPMGGASAPQTFQYVPLTGD